MGLVNIPPLNQTLLLINWPNKGILSFMNTEYWGKGDSNVTGGAVFCHETHCHLISDALKYRWAELYLYQTSKASMALRCWVKNITINVHIRSAWHAQTGNQNKNWRQNMVLHETTFWVGEKSVSGNVILHRNAMLYLWDSTSLRWRWPAYERDLDCPSVR